MQVCSEHLKLSVLEMRRVGTLVNKTRRLIAMSKDTGVPLTDEEDAARKHLQAEIEDICATPLAQPYIELGKALDAILVGAAEKYIEVVPPEIIDCKLHIGPGV